MNIYQKQREAKLFNQLLNKRTEKIQPKQMENELKKESEEKLKRVFLIIEIFLKVFFWLVPIIAIILTIYGLSTIKV